MSTARKLARLALVLGVLGLIAAGGTYAAFSSTTTNPDNRFDAGSVALSDNDGGTALLSLSGAVPGDSNTRCITVTYNGSLAAAVRLYGTVSGSLPSYLQLTVTRGTDPAPSFASCSGFTADSSDYIGAGPGVIYSGSLASFPSSFASGIVDPAPGAPATWTTSEAHTYQFTVSLNNDPAAQGLSGSASFTWEARNQ